MFAGYVAAARNTAPFAIAAVGLLVLLVASTFFVNSEGFGYDFQAYADAARRIAAGESPYLPNTVRSFAAGLYEGLYLYPPPLAVALLPFTAFDEALATTVWMAFRLVLLGVGCLVLPVSFRVRLVTLGVAGISYPVLFDLNIGNVSIVTFALAAVAWRWMGRPAVPIVHAALALIRFPFLIYGLLWIVQRRFSSLAWTIVAGGVMVLLAIPFVGSGSYEEYLGIVQGLPDLCTGPHFLCWESSGRSVGVPEMLAVIATPMAYGVGLAALVFAGLRRDESTAFVVAAMATLLVTPFIHPHYLVLLLLPAAFLMDRGHWWTAGLPLIGWLPDPVLPFVSLLAIGLVLLASEGPKKREEPAELGE